MVLQLAPLKEEDIHQFNLIASTAFQSGLGHLLIGPVTDKNLAQNDVSNLKKFKEKPNAHFFKVVDSETGEMVAGAQWYIYPNGNTEAELSEMFVYPTVEAGYRKEYDPIYTYLNDSRREVMGTRPYVFLNVLFTHPDHHRRGAGAMAVKWGVDEADRLGVEAYVEGSKEGRPLYERFGFKAVKVVEWEMAQFGRPDLGTDVHCIMHREAVGNAN